MIEVGGLLDDATLRFLVAAIEDAAADGSEIAIVQLNSPGAIGSLDVLEAGCGASWPIRRCRSSFGSVRLRPVAGGGAAQLLGFRVRGGGGPRDPHRELGPGHRRHRPGLCFRLPEGLELPYTVEDADHGPGRSGGAVDQAVDPGSRW